MMLLCFYQKIIKRKPFNPMWFSLKDFKVPYYYRFSLNIKHAIPLYLKKNNCFESILNSRPNGISAVRYFSDFLNKRVSQILGIFVCIRK